MPRQKTKEIQQQHYLSPLSFLHSSTCTFSAANLRVNISSGQTAAAAAAALPLLDNVCYYYVVLHSPCYPAASSRQPNIMSGHFCCNFCFCHCFTTTTTTTAADKLPRSSCQGLGTTANHRSGEGKEVEKEKKKNDKIYDPEQRRETTPACSLQLRRRKEKRATTKNWCLNRSQPLLQPLTISENSAESSVEDVSVQPPTPATPALHLILMIHCCKSSSSNGPGSNDDKINRNLSCGHLITATTLHPSLLLFNGSVHYHHQQKQRHCLSHPSHHHHLSRPRPANEGNDFQKSEHYEKRQKKEKEEVSFTLLCMMSPRHHQMRQRHQQQHLQQQPHHFHAHQHASLALICLLVFSFSVTVAPFDDGCFCSSTFCTTFRQLQLLLQNCCCCCLLTTRTAVSFFSSAAEAMNINELCHRWWCLELAVNFFSLPSSFSLHWPTFALQSPLQQTRVLHLSQNSREICCDRKRWIIQLGGNDTDDFPDSSKHYHHQGHLDDQEQNLAAASRAKANQLTTTGSTSISQTVNLNNATNGDLYASSTAVLNDQLLLLLLLLFFFFLYTTGGHLSSKLVGWLVGLRPMASSNGATVTEKEKTSRQIKANEAC